MDQPFKLVKPNTPEELEAKFGIPFDQLCVTCRWCGRTYIGGEITMPQIHGDMIRHSCCGMGEPKCKRYRLYTDSLPFPRKLHFFLRGSPGNEIMMIHAPAPVEMTLEAFRNSVWEMFNSQENRWPSSKGFKGKDIVLDLIRKEYRKVPRQ